MPNAQDIIERHAARVLLMDAGGRVLLFRCEEPGAGRSFWITPGGGLEPGETHEQAAARELREETGLSLKADRLGPCVWTRTHTFPWLGKTYRQHERFYSVRLEGRHAVDPAEHTDEERKVLTGHRWWSAGEINASQEVFAPRRLGQLLADLSHRLPQSPIDAGR